MDPKDFATSPSGRLVETVYGQKAFVPNPLPPEIDFGVCKDAVENEHVG